MSWLDLRGKPVVATLTITVPADTPNLVESKSLKLYLNSFNATRFADAAEVRTRIAADLSRAAGGTVQVDAGLPPMASQADDAFLLDDLGNRAMFAVDDQSVQIESFAIQKMRQVLGDRRFADAHKPRQNYALIVVH